MKDNLLVITNVKKTVLYLDKIVYNFPNSEKVLKDKIMTTIYDILEYIYIANEVNDINRVMYQKKIVAKMKMIDFYLKVSSGKKYISYKKYQKASKYLMENLKQIYGWIKSEKTG